MQDTQRNEEFTQVIRKRLGEKRFTHSMCVAQSARELAEQYGADPERAYTAGILHDVMKEAPGEEQLQTIAAAGIILTDVERANKKLWHAMAGFAYCRDTLHVTDPGILDAIRYHTTGRAGMTLWKSACILRTLSARTGITQAWMRSARARAVDWRRSCSRA